MPDRQAEAAMRRPRRRVRPWLLDRPGWTQVRCAGIIALGPGGVPVPVPTGDGWRFAPTWRPQRVTAPPFASARPDGQTARVLGAGTVTRAGWFLIELPVPQEQLPVAPDSHFVVHVRLGPGGLRIDSRPVSVRMLAQAIRCCPAWRRRPVVLTCAARVEEPVLVPMLTSLATALGVEVLGSTGPVLLGPRILLADNGFVARGPAATQTLDRGRTVPTFRPVAAPRPGAGARSQPGSGPQVEAGTDLADPAARHPRSAVPKAPGEPRGLAGSVVPMVPATPMVAARPTVPAAPMVAARPTVPAAPMAAAKPRVPLKPTVAAKPTVPVKSTVPIRSVEPMVPTVPTVPAVPSAQARRTPDAHPVLPGQEVLPAEDAPPKHVGAARSARSHPIAGLPDVGPAESGPTGPEPIGSDESEAFWGSRPPASKTPAASAPAGSRRGTAHPVGNNPGGPQVSSPQLREPAVDAAAATVKARGAQPPADSGPERSGGSQEPVAGPPVLTPVGAVLDLIGLSDCPKKIDPQGIPDGMAEQPSGGPVRSGAVVRGSHPAPAAAQLGQAGGLRPTGSDGDVVENGSDPEPESSWGSQGSQEGPAGRVNHDIQDVRPPEDVAWVRTDGGVRPGDRERVRSLLGWRYEAHSRAVTGILALQPGLRVRAGQDDLMVGLVAVYAYLAGASAVIDAVLRGEEISAEGGFADIDAEGAVVLARCARSGLNRLPAVVGPVFRAGSPGSEQVKRYRSGLRVVEPTFTEARLTPTPASETTVEYAIWSSTARRTDRMVAASDGARVMFAPGTQFDVLDVVQPQDGDQLRVLLRERLVRTAGDRPDRDLAERTRNRLWESLAEREPARRAGVELPTQWRYPIGMRCAGDLFAVGDRPEGS